MSRGAAIAVAVALIVVAVVLAPLAPALQFSAHMAGHMLLVAAVPPLLVHGLRGSRLDVDRIAPALLSPIVASMVEMVLVWAWHVPAMHHAAQSHLSIRLVEQLSFFGSGMYLWAAVLAGSRSIRRRRAPRAILGLLLTSMHMTLLGAIITLSGRPLFADHGGGHILGQLHDQQLGGAIMIVMGNAIYLSGILWLAAHMVGRREEVPR